MKTKKDDAFSFAETIAVLAIMLILTAGVGFSAAGYVQKARRLSAESQIEVYRLALQSYYLDCGSYPSDEQGLAALWEKPLLYPVPAGWRGPYVDREIQKDPWGKPFIYSSRKNRNLPFTILSLGSDGLEGGSGDAEDIVSWK
ncbi:MAG: type II secretion system major pseudopilin GspG [Treponemataceae bacterium]|nr:type II secretion system major pseudopilin GspG [Treponemataceae bacterium]